MKSRITDLAYLNSISEGDEEFKKDMISTFLDTSSVYLADMKKYLASGDWKKVGDIAHSMKPSFTMLGMQGKKEIIQAIENSGRNNSNPGQLPALVAELESVILQASAELMKELE
jgi:HPt (histidine-containing phosphotransfer) domain-containing protein